jgi:hypothetical protein
VVHQSSLAGIVKALAAAIYDVLVAQQQHLLSLAYGRRRGSGTLTLQNDILIILPAAACVP